MKIFFGQQFIQNRINNRNEKHFKQRPISFCAASGEDGFQKPNLKYVDNFLLYENRGATGLSSEIIQFLKRNYACMALLNEALHNLRRLEKGEVDFKAIKELAMINYSPETREDLDGFLEKCGITSNEKLIEVATALEILEKRNIDGARKPSEIIKLCVDPRIPKEIFLAYPNLLIEASFGNELYEEQIDCAKMLLEKMGR